MRLVFVCTIAIYNYPSLENVGVPSIAYWRVTLVKWDDGEGGEPEWRIKDIVTEEVN